MPPADSVVPELRSFSIRLSSPLWIEVPAVVLVLAAGIAGVSAAEDKLDPNPVGKAARATAYRLVFGDGSDAVAARMRLDMLLQEKLTAVDRVCQLTETQKQKLELAGRGDNLRLIQRVEEIGKRIQLQANDPDKAADLQATIRDAQRLHRGSKPGFPDDESLFVKSLAKTLTAEQRALYEPLRVVYRMGGLVQTLQIGSEEVLEVNLIGTAIADDGLARLNRLPGLQSLYLSNTQVTDAGLVHLKGLGGLQRLSLDDTQVTDAGLLHLHGLTDLRTLFVRNTKVTDAGVSELQHAIPGLTVHAERIPAKSLMITVAASPNGDVASLTVGLARLFDGRLDGGRMRQMDRRLKDVFAIEGAFDQVVLRVHADLAYSELMRICDVCLQQKMADGRQVDKISIVELGDRIAPAEAPLNLPAVGSAHLLDMKPGDDLLELNVSVTGEILVAGRRDPALYLAKEANMARKRLKVGGKNVKPGDDLPTVVIVRADKTTPFAMLKKVLTECDKNGFRKLALDIVEDE